MDKKSYLNIETPEIKIQSANLEEGQTQQILDFIYLHQNTKTFKSKNSFQQRRREAKSEKDFQERFNDFFLGVVVLSFSLACILIPLEISQKVQSLNSQQTENSYVK